MSFLGNFGTVFVDQSYWQSSVAAKPKQGVWGFLLGGLVWFAVPFTFATTMGLSYIALSARQGDHLLTTEDVNAGQLHAANVSLKIVVIVVPKEELAHRVLPILLLAQH